MKKQSFSLLSIAVSVMMLLICLCPAFAQEQQKVRAKIGIQIFSDRAQNPAGSRELVKAGDRIRIYVHPLESAYVYVVYSDDRTAKLLNKTRQHLPESLMVLPSEQAYYKVDGNSAMENFTIVCSPQELPQISGLADADMPGDRWLLIQEELTKKSGIELSRQRTAADVELAGNVRGADELKNTEVFVKNLPIFSGKGFVVRKYEFKLQN
ncbi:MAG: hypothetical protein AB7S75_18465 [Desulfococcaceae bacterium]